MNGPGQIDLMLARIEGSTGAVSLVVKALFVEVLSFEPNTYYY